MSFRATKAVDIKLMPAGFPNLSGNIKNYAVSLEITFSEFYQTDELRDIYELLLFLIPNAWSKNQMIQSSDWGENIVFERSI